MQFRDRRDAGRRLACELADLAAADPVVVALPRGGVPVAYEVAHALHAPLEILAVRKLGAPANAELAIGALAEDGTGVVDQRSAARLGVSEATLEATLARESAELRRRVERYRDGRPAVPLEGRTAIVVDDGLATGLTDLAAVRAVRKRGARSVVVAVPVGSREAIEMLEQEADRVVCVMVPERLMGVGMWYRDFAPVADEEVEALLASAARGFSGPHADVRQSEPAPEADEHELVLQLDGVTLGGSLSVPALPTGLVLFAHGSGSSRMSPRNRAVAAALNAAGFATLLFDLLDEREAGRRELVFDTVLLASRLAAVTRWATEQPPLQRLPVGYFGASTGAAAALRAAAELQDVVAAVVSRGGRPDLAGERLAEVLAPTLLIVGSRDVDVLDLNRRAAAALRCPHEVAVVDGAAHLFEEPGKLEQVARLASDWFRRHLSSASAEPLAGAA